MLSDWFRMISYPSFILFQHPILHHQVLCPRMCLAYGLPIPTGWGCRREGEDEKDPALDPTVFLLTREGPMSLQLIRFYAKGFRKTQISYILLNLLIFVVFIRQVRANIVREIYSILWGKLTSIWQSVDLQISIPAGQFCPPKLHFDVGTHALNMYVILLENKGNCLKHHIKILYHMSHSLPLRSNMSEFHYSQSDNRTTVRSLMFSPMVPVSLDFSVEDAFTPLALFQFVLAPVAWCSPQLSNHSTRKT